MLTKSSYGLADRFTATAGLRYYGFNEKRRFPSGGLVTNLDDDRDRSCCRCGMLRRGGRNTGS